MRIIVDAFGGDNAPLEVLRGCAMAVKEYGVDIIACPVDYSENMKLIEKLGEVDFGN